MRKGICCAGNMIVDITYPIETWPKQNELTHITEGIQNSTGACGSKRAPHPRNSTPGPPRTRSSSAVPAGTSKRSSTRSWRPTKTPASA